MRTQARLGAAAVSAIAIGALAATATSVSSGASQGVPGRLTIRVQSFPTGG